MVKKAEQMRLDRWQQQQQPEPVPVARVSVWTDDGTGAGELLPCPELHKLLLRGERCPQCDQEKTRG